MISHLLIDLDDTLLENNMDTFAPAYYKALSTYMSSLVQPDRLLAELMKGTLAMIKNDDPDQTLEMVFDAVFYPGLGVTKADLIARLNNFYSLEFPNLQPLTKPIPAARDLVNHTIEQGMKVTVATNPLFPRTAIEQRLCWANLDPRVVPFTYIPSYETAHFAKPNPKYYLELISILGTEPQNCLMIGNDLQADILPALQAGLHAFHINDIQPNEWQRRDGYLEGTILAAGAYLAARNL